MISNTQWIMRWYQERCNEEWEHAYGVKIDTLDNPGWDVKIDVAETPLESLERIFHSDPWEDDADWYGYAVKDSVFHGYGDPTKLDALLGAFRGLWEEYAENNLGTR